MAGKVDVNTYRYIWLIIANMDNWVHIDDPNTSWDYPSQEPDPETLLLRREREERFKNLSGLSEEAKAVVRLVKNCPKEIFNRSNFISKNSIREFIRREWGWQYSTINKAFREIGAWLKSL